jgi:hypothetical protein
MLKERNWKTGQLHQTTSSGFRTQKLQKKNGIGFFMKVKVRGDIFPMKLTSLKSEL